jgi:hypothetical protein
MPGSKGGGLTVGKAKNLIRIAKVVVPAVAPVVLPFAIRAAAGLRAALDQARARRLGIDVDELPKFSGRGGALLARIAGDAKGMGTLRDSGGEAARFAETGQTELAELTAVVRAAERMPTTRRRAAHRAVAVHLDRLEDELLRRLGVE